MNQIEFRVNNLDYEHDASNLERGLAGFTGLIDLKIYLKSAKVGISYDPALTKPETIKEKLETLGFPPQKRQGAGRATKALAEPKGAGICGIGHTVAAGLANQPGRRVGDSLNGDLHPCYSYRRLLLWPRGN